MTIINQFMQAPCEEHMEAVNRILRYLKTTPGKGSMSRKTNGELLSPILILTR